MSDRKLCYKIKNIETDFGFEIIAIFDLGVLIIGSGKTKIEAELQAATWSESQKEWAVKVLAHQQ